MLSLSIEASRAFCTARASAAFPSMSPPPSLAATTIARASLVKSLPLRESTIAFLCLIDAHFECPDMTLILRPPPSHAPRIVPGRMPIDPSIFKAYDIRGIYAEQIDGDVAEQIGRAFVRVIAELDGK